MQQVFSECVVCKYCFYIKRFIYKIYDKYISVGVSMSFSCKKGEFDRCFNRLDRPVEESRPDRFPCFVKTSFFLVFNRIQGKQLNLKQNFSHISNAFGQCCESVPPCKIVQFKYRLYIDRFESADSGSIPDRIKPKTMKIGSHCSVV